MSCKYPAAVRDPPPAGERAPARPFGEALRRYLGGLFPRCETRIRWSSFAVVAHFGAFAAIMAASLLRQSGLPATKTIWAEDGPVFLGQADVHSFGWSLTQAYNGYIQLWPRLIAELAVQFALRDAATVFALSGAAAIAALSLVVFHSAKAHIRSPSLRALLAAAMVLLPIANGELLNNAVNVPWWLYFAVFWMLLWRPATLSGKLVAGIVCFVAAASDPLVALYFPLLAARVIALPKPREHFATLGLLAGIAYQAAVILRSPRSVAPGTSSAHGVFRSYVLHVGLGWLTGARGTNHLLETSTGLALVLGTMIFLAVAGAGLLWRDRELRLFTLTSLLFSVLMFVVPVWDRGVGTIMDVGPITNGGRYALCSILLIIGVVLRSADRSLARAASSRAAGAPRHAAVLRPRLERSHVVALLICCVLLVPAWVVDLRDPNGRSAAQPWSAQVSKAAVDCRTDPAGTFKFDTSPSGWSTELPCRSVIESSS